MDLLALFRTLWRHKLVVIPVLVLILLGLVYVLKVKPPTYNADAELSLIPPPGAPSAAQIQADPALAKINTNNPYLNSSGGNLALVGDDVMDLVTGHSTQQTLAALGVSPKYQVAMSADPGNPPIMDITGVGTSAAAAIYSAQKVMAAATTDLQNMQAQVNVLPKYMITAEPLLVPTSAQTSISSKLRTLIAVLGGGLILLFMVVSIAEAITRRREEELDIPVAKPRRYTIREEPRGLEQPAESTQEFASPFLSSGARRPVHSLGEGRSALPTSGRRRDSEPVAEADGD